MVLNAENIKIKEMNESNLPELKQIDSFFSCIRNEAIQKNLYFPYSGHSG